MVKMKAIFEAVHNDTMRMLWIKRLLSSLHWCSAILSNEIMATRPLIYGKT